MAVAVMVFFFSFVFLVLVETVVRMIRVILPGVTMLWKGLPAKKCCKQQGLYSKVDTTTVSNNSCMSLIDILYFTNLHIVFH